MHNVTYVRDFFQHDTLPTGPSTGFRANTVPALGLLDRAYSTDSTFDRSTANTPWLRFLHWLKTANKENESIHYKLLLVVRHGEAEHNVKEHQVGRQAWEDHWAMIDGDSESSWADARLTSKGEIEAMDLGRFWTRDMLPRGVPFPEQLYSSPLTRCIQTVTLASQALDDNEKNHNKDAPSIRVAECLRETLGVHTCDRRSTRSDLATSFPHLMFDEDFTENDELWQTDHRESFEECTARLTVWLQKLFAEDASDVLLVAAHSGSIRALLRAAGHPDVWPGRGSINPLLLKAEVV